MKIDRRHFLGTAALGTAGLLVSRGPVHAQTTTAAADPTALVPLGKRLKFPRMGMGTGVRGIMRTSEQIRMGVDKFEEVIRKAYDEGIRYFDMADIYGSHPIVGRVLKDKPRDSYVLGSKVWFLPGGLPESEREDADVAVKRFLKEYGTDYLDLVEIHCMTDPKWPEQMRKQMDLLEGLREKGLIRAHGVSVHSLGALEAAADEPWVDVVHARINHEGVQHGRQAGQSRAGAEKNSRRRQRRDRHETHRPGPLAQRSGQARGLHPLRPRPGHGRYAGRGLPKAGGNRQREGAYQDGIRS